MFEFSYQELALILFLNILVGLLGNFINLIVLWKKNLRKISTFQFLFYLSIIDLLVLVICASDSMLTYGFYIEIRLYSSFTCKIHTFLTYFLTHMSSLILMCVSIDRVLVICGNSSILTKILSRKLKIYKFYTVKRVFLSLAVFLFIINVHFLVYFDLNENGLSIKPYEEIDKVNFQKEANKSFEKLIKNSHKSTLESKFNLINYKHNSNLTDNLSTEFLPFCYSFKNLNHIYFMNSAWIWIDSLLYSFIPFIVMFICSLIVLYHVNKSTSHLIQLVSSRSNQNLLANRFKRNKQIGYMLMANNLFFCLSSLPYCIISFNTNLINMDIKDAQKLFLVHILSYMNNSFNFVFYGFFSNQYRSVLINLLNCQRHKIEVLNKNNNFRAIVQIKKNKLKISNFNN